MVVNAVTSWLLNGCCRWTNQLIHGRESLWRKWLRLSSGSGLLKPWSGTPKWLKFTVILKLAGTPMTWETPYIVRIVLPAGDWSGVDLQFLTMTMFMDKASARSLLVIKTPDSTCSWFPLVFFLLCLIGYPHSQKDAMEYRRWVTDFTVGDKQK